MWRFFRYRFALLANPTKRRCCVGSLSKWQASNSCSQNREISTNFLCLTSINKNATVCFAKIAGAHSYVDNDAVATANANYICFHTTKNGKHTLTLKDEAEVFDVLEKKNLGRFKTKVFDLKMGDVKLFKLKK